MHTFVGTGLSSFGKGADVQQERRNAIIIAVLLCLLVSLAMVAWALALLLLIPWLFSPMMSSQ